MSDDEAPSEADMERFSGVTRICPECKTEVYDEATLCHECGHAFGASGSGKGVPTWAVATVVGTLGVLALGMVFM